MDETGAERGLERESINPWDWGLQFQMDQGEVVSGATRMLHCSGQVAMEVDAESPSGFRALAEGDLRGQMASALANVDAVLEGAGMTRANLLTLRFFTTDVDGFLANYDVYAEWIAEAGVRPPQSLLGVNRLVLPETLVEIEATAAD